MPETSRAICASEVKAVYARNLASDLCERGKSALCDLRAVYARNIASDLCER